MNTKERFYAVVGGCVGAVSNDGGLLAVSTGGAKPIGCQLR